MNDIYLNTLGRKSDPEGLKYWTDQMNKGVSEDAITKSFNASDEKKKLEAAGKEKEKEDAGSDHKNRITITSNGGQITISSDGGRIRIGNGSDQTEAADSDFRRRGKSRSLASLERLWNAKKEEVLSYCGSGEGSATDCAALEAELDSIEEKMATYAAEGVPSGRKRKTLEQAVRNLGMSLAEAKANPSGDEIVASRSGASFVSIKRSPVTKKSRSVRGAQ